MNQESNFIQTTQNPKYGGIQRPALGT